MEKEEKNIKDYLHLYIGCDVMVDLTPQAQPKKGKLIGVFFDVWHWTISLYTETAQVEFGFKSKQFYKLTQIKPILRLLSSATDDEKKEYETLQGVRCAWDDKCIIHTHNYLIDMGSPHVWRWALSKGFDLFGLIDDGLALNGTDVPNAYK